MESIEEYSSAGEPMFISDFKDNIVHRCKEILKTKDSVRVLYIAVDEMGLQVSTHDVIEVVFALYYTGKYEYFKGVPYGDVSDFIIRKKPRKSFKERYWVIIAIIAYLIGLLTPTIQKSIQQKILPEPNQSRQATPASSDTYPSYKNP